MRRRLTAMGVVTALTVTGVWAAGLPVTGTARARPAGYHGQVIGWHGCRTGPDDRLGAALDAAKARCAEVRVPLDYARPDGRTITVALARVRATDPARRRGVLFINPGGPGVSGMEQVLIGSITPEVASRYDLVGMDPRFTGRSTPLHCAWTTDTPTRSAGPDHRTFEESVSLARSLAAGCAHGDRSVLPYASTRNAARDMDVIRAALGESRISYLGVSYGTYLGAVYLQLFVHRADRFVLDSAVDPAVAGPGMFRAQGPAASAALRNWAAFAAHRDSRYSLGITPTAVLSTVNRIAAAATRRPLPVGRYRIDTHVLPLILFAELADDSEEAYEGLATDVRTLDRAARGAEVTPTAALERFLTGVFTGAGPATDRAGTPVLCADRAASPNPETYFRDIQAHRTTEPLFGPLTRNVTPCAFWPVKPSEPPLTIDNGSRALIVGASGDPLAPYKGQRKLHRALTASRMITLRGAFRHGVYLAAGSPCIDEAVNAYLTVGTLPVHDTTCTSATH